MWKVVTSSNLNLPLKFYFYSPIVANNNMLLKIYCENIVVAFLNCNFLFFILFLSFIHTIFFFTTRVYPLLSPSSPFFLYFFFYLILEPLSLSLSFSNCLFFFFFSTRSFSSCLCDKKWRKW